MNSRKEKYYNYIVDDIIAKNRDDEYLTGEITNGRYISIYEFDGAFLPDHIVGVNVIKKYGTSDEDLKIIADMVYRRIRNGI